MRGIIAALGNFDGVHIGHRQVIEQAVTEGVRRGKEVVAATFDPHPRAVVHPPAPSLLTDLSLKRDILLSSGVDRVHVIRFDRDLSRKNPEEFVSDVLVGQIGADVVVVGENFRFGHRASGTVQDMVRIMAGLGGEVVVVPIMRSKNGINSTRIRTLLSEGNVEEAARLLGRPYVIRGRVVAGESRGQKIGFPTANVLPGDEVLIPARGVYTGFARIAEERYPCCINVGVAPTFDRRESWIEAHLLGFEGDLYERIIDVSFETRLRGEKKFSGIEELKEQIARDVAETRRLTYGCR